MPWEHLDPSRCRLRLPSPSIPASSFVFDTMILTSFNRCFRGFCTFLAHLLRLSLSSKSLVVWRNNLISYIHWPVLCYEILNCGVTILYLLFTISSINSWRIYNREYWFHYPSPRFLCVYYYLTPHNRLVLNHRLQVVCIRGGRIICALLPANMHRTLQRGRRNLSRLGRAALSNRA